MPVSHEYGYGVSDYYYSCVTRDTQGNYDFVGDLYVGRFCVAPNLTNGLEELRNIIDKTIYFESEYSFSDWRNQVHVINGRTLLDDTYWDVTYPAFIDPLIYPKERTSANCRNYSFAYPALELMKEGSLLLIVDTHGFVTAWELGLTATLLKDSLTNINKTPFCVTQACSLGEFQSGKCLPQQLTTYSHNKGFVAIIAASEFVGAAEPYPPYIIENPPKRFPERVPYTMFHNQLYIAGEIFLETFINNLSFAKFFNLFGDPALNVMAEGYQITNDVIAECLTKITCKVRIHSGATLTVPANCNLSFLPEGKLTIDERGSIVIEDGARVTGINNEMEDAIHVKGGGFTVGENVTFQDLTGGILLENARDAQGGTSTL